jgi:D-glycero-alpha-D-manno-heptose-7-phosphate kinase
MTRRDLPTEIHAAAPLRLDFAGAWTDVPPFSAREGGVVVNAAIRLHAHATLQLGGTLLRLVSEELGESLECVNSGGLVPDGKLTLLKAGLRMFPVLGNFTLTTRSDAPAGSGLGGSGALDVALVAALTSARAERLSASELAEQAWYLEVVEARIPGGRQDQLAAALGGFHRFTFRDPDVGIEPLTLDPAFAAALERQTLLCHTGPSRPSGGGDTIARVMSAYERGDRGVAGALRSMKDVAERSVEALRAGDLARLGTLLAEQWTHQQALDPAIRTDAMARLERAMAGAGALGGKAAGVGLGGSMFFLVGDRRAAVEAAAAAGASLLPVAWAPKGEGARVW